MSRQRHPQIQSFRQQAEALLQKAADQRQSPELADMRSLFHELQVHQIELELQNEELRAAHSQLELSRSHYMRLFHQAPVGYVVLDRSGLITEANATFSEMVQQDRDALLHRPFHQLLNAETVPFFLARFRALLKHPQDKQIELQLATTDAQPVHVSLSARPHVQPSSSVQPQEPELFLTITDISEKKFAEQALQASEQLAHSTINALTAHIAILDEQGTILYVNKSWQAFARANGIAPELVGEGSNYFSLCSSVKGEEDQDAKDFSEGIRAVLRGERDLYMQEYPCHSPTENRWFVGRVTRFPGMGTNRAVVAHENITQRKELEQENLHLQQHLYRLEKEDSLARMAGALAHHFNNQLFAVMGNLELFMEGYTHIPEQPHLESAMTSLRSAAQLSNRMLTYLGINNKGKKQIDLSAEVRLLLSMLLISKPAQVDLTPELPTTGPILDANPEQLREVITNLVENGWEALEQQPGYVTIRVTTVKSEDIYSHHRLPLQWEPDCAQYACIEVEDQGCGMTDQEMERIFDPFYSKKFLGRGMGLPLVLGIVRAHKGCITLASKPQQGTKIRIYLPLEQ